MASTGLAMTGVCLVPHRLFGDEENLVVAARKSGEAANVTVQALRRNVSALIGSGGNIAVLPGDDGKLIIDSGYLGTRNKIAAALSRRSPDPIKHLVNTHWHFDHTDGNEWTHSSGATITAHENTRRHLSTSTRVEDWNFTFPPSPAGAIPTDVFNARRFTSMTPPLRSNITARVTPMAMSRFTLLKLMSSTRAILGGTDTIHSSIIRLAAALTA
jgi:phosphoribosyl 1,2-cyclic phosphodiesterase